jgi:hypothetical protein
MKATRPLPRYRTSWIQLATLCGLFCALTPAAHAQPARIGTVLGIPISDLESFRLANAASGVNSLCEVQRPNEITVLHVSPAAGSPLNTVIATVSITTADSGQKAWRVCFPMHGGGTISPLYNQINANDFFLNPRILDGGNMAAVQVDVRQSSIRELELERARFLLVPATAVRRLESENPAARIAPLHLQRMAVGSQLLWVQLVAIDGASANELRLPSDLASEIQALNTNLTVTSGGVVKVN